MTDEELGRTIDEAGSLPKDAIDPMTGQTFGAGNVPAMHAAMGAAARRLVIAELLAGAGIKERAIASALEVAFEPYMDGAVYAEEVWVDAAEEAISPILVRLVAERDAVREALSACVLQIEYLHEKFGETGSGNGVLMQARASLTP